MSDHFTRVTTGGSPMPKQAPVVGLLFGHTNDATREKDTTSSNTGGIDASSSSYFAAGETKHHSLLSIVDAEDIPLAEPVPAVDLHQAVFPKNVVVGCYRVTLAESQPTAADIRQVQALARALATTTTTTASSNSSDGGQVKPKMLEGPFFFGLLQVNPKVVDDGGGGKTNSGSQESSSELPLQLFVLPPAPDDSVLVAVDDWHLTTAAAAERIAVERVLRDKKPKQQQGDDGQVVDDEAKLAWLALDARLQRIMEFLQQTIATTSSSSSSSPMPEHLELWRAVQGLLVQASLLRTAQSGGSSTTMLPQQVAVLAKTVDAIAWYTDKFRVVYEAKGASAVSLRERRF